MKTEKEAGRSASGQVVNLESFRKKKEVDTELTRGGRKPLYVSHMTGKVTGSPSAKAETQDFGDRLQRIRSSLEKINRLMGELKKMSSADAEAPAATNEISSSKTLK